MQVFASAVPLDDGDEFLRLGLNTNRLRLIIRKIMDELVRRDRH